MHETQTHQVLRRLCAEVAPHKTFADGMRAFHFLRPRMRGTDFEALRHALLECAYERAWKLSTPDGEWTAWPSSDAFVAMLLRLDEWTLSAPNWKPSFLEAVATLHEATWAIVGAQDADDLTVYVFSGPEW